MPVRFPEGLSETSQPTAAQAAELITLVGDLTIATTDEPTPALVGLARATVALGVAAYIENGGFPEQSEAGAGGPAEFYRRRYAEQVAQLRYSIVTARRTLPVPAPGQVTP